MIDVFPVLIILMTGIFSGMFGTLAGGSGLIGIPVLIILGFSPQTAIGTFFFGVTGMNLAGWYGFHRKQFIDYRIGLLVAIPTFAGAILGATIVLQINEGVLKKVSAILTLLTLAFMLVNPNIGLENKKRIIRRREYLMAGALSLLLGVYLGFYGAVAGTFLSYILIFLFGQTFLESAATRKIALTFSSLIATIIFALGGTVIYPVGVQLLLSTAIGAYIAVYYSDRIGNVWIKRLFMLTAFIMAIKLVL